MDRVAIVKALAENERNQFIDIKNQCKHKIMNEFKKNNKSIIFSKSWKNYLEAACYELDFAVYTKLENGDYEVTFIDKKN